MRFTTLLFALIMALPAYAGFRAYNGSTDLDIFDSIKCSTGLTCTRAGDKLTIVSSPTITAGTFDVIGAEATNGILSIIADEGDDNGDTWTVEAVASGNALSFTNDTSGSAVQKLALSTGGVLTFADSETLTNASDQLTFTFDDAAGRVNILGFEASNAALYLQADESDDNGDDWAIVALAAGGLAFQNDATGSMASKVTMSTSGELAGFRSTQVAATATTITSAQCGSTFSNSGAVQMELPEASTVIGCTLTFVTLNASNFDVNPDDADQILTQTNALGDAMRNATVGNSIMIRAVSASQWAVIGINGTWSDIN